MQAGQGDASAFGILPCYRDVRTAQELHRAGQEIVDEDDRLLGAGRSTLAAARPEVPHPDGRERAVARAAARGA